MHYLFRAAAGCIHALASAVRNNELTSIILGNIARCFEMDLILARLNDRLTHSHSFSALMRTICVMNREMLSFRRKK